MSPEFGVATLQLATTKGCGLAIGAYPRFRYDARGGGGPRHRPGRYALPGREALHRPVVRQRRRSIAGRARDQREGQSGEPSAVAALIANSIVHDLILFQK